MASDRRVHFSMQNEDNPLLHAAQELQSFFEHANNELENIKASNEMKRDELKTLDKKLEEWEATHNSMYARNASLRLRVQRTNRSKLLLEQDSKTVNFDSLEITSSETLRNMTKLKERNKSFQDLCDSLDSKLNSREIELQNNATTFDEENDRLENELKELQDSFELEKKLSLEEESKRNLELQELNETFLKEQVIRAELIERQNLFEKVSLKNDEVGQKQRELLEVQKKGETLKQLVEVYKEIAVVKRNIKDMEEKMNDYDINEQDLKRAKLENGIAMLQARLDETTNINTKMGELQNLEQNQRELKKSLLEAKKNLTKENKEVEDLRTSLEQYASKAGINNNDLIKLIMHKKMHLEGIIETQMNIPDDCAEKLECLQKELQPLNVKLEETQTKIQEEKENHEKFKVELAKQFNKAIEVQKRSIKELTISKESIDELNDLGIEVRVLKEALSGRGFDLNKLDDITQESSVQRITKKMTNLRRDNRDQSQHLDDVTESEIDLSELSF